MPLLRGFAPVFRSDAQVLILGSLPGARSLAQQQYYGHPRNQFWRLVGGVIGHDLSALTYAERLTRLMDHRIALWDVVASGQRQGSLDAALRIAEHADVATLLDHLPQLQAIAFNGALAAAQARLPAAGAALLSLPSSSPANTMPLAAKQQAWAALHPYLAP